MAYTPRKELRDQNMKHSLKSYIVSHVVKRYQVVAVRALWDTENAALEIWAKRRQMEMMLEEIPTVRLIISCITALPAPNPYKKQKSSHEDSEEDIRQEPVREGGIDPGFSFWIAFDCPHQTTYTFEERITKLFMEAGLSLKQCRTVRGRGKNNFTFSFLLCVCACACVFLICINM